MDEERTNPVEVVRRGYDAASWHYRADDAEGDRYGEWVAQLLAALPAASRVLDLGCGCGVPVARDLDAAGHRVTGVDVSEVQISRARRLVPGARFLCADAATVRFDCESFDAVVALYSLIHVPVRAQPALLRAIADWLIPDGLLLMTAGWRACTGSEPGWLGSDASMWWSQADVATYRDWLATAGFAAQPSQFVPEGDSGHSLFWARRRRTPGVGTPGQP